MRGQRLDRSVVDFVELLDLLSSFLAYRPDSRVSLTRDSIADDRFVCFELQLELVHPILGRRFGQFDEPLGFASRLFEHCLELDFCFEEAAELARGVRVLWLVSVPSLC